MYTQKCKTIIVVLSCMFTLALALPLCAETTSQIPGELTAWQSRALTHNPRIHEAESAALAAAQRAPQVFSLPDPRVGYAPMLDRFDHLGRPLQQKVFVEQMFPPPGTRQRRMELAEWEAYRLYLRAEAVRREVEYETASVFADAMLLSVTLQRLDEHLALLDEMISALRAMVTTGDTPASSLLDVDMERSTLQVERTSWEARRSPLVARINTLLNCHHIPSSWDFPQAWPPIVEPPLPSALDSPTVQMARAAKSAAQTQLDLAHLRRYPGMAVGMEWIYKDAPAAMGTNSSEQMVMLMASINLPIWRKSLQAGETEAAFGIESSEQAEVEATLQFEAMLAQAQFEFSDAVQRLELYQQELLPTSRQQLDMTRSAYETGRVTLSDWIRSQRRVLDLELSVERVRADALKAVWRIRQLGGA